MGAADDVDAGDSAGVVLHAEMDHAFADGDGVGGGSWFKGRGRAGIDGENGPILKAAVGADTGDGPALAVGKGDFDVGGAVDRLEGGGDFAFAGDEAGGSVEAAAGGVEFVDPDDGGGEAVDLVEGEGRGGWRRDRRRGSGRCGGRDGHFEGLGGGGQAVDADVELPDAAGHASGEVEGPIGLEFARGRLHGDVGDASEFAVGLFPDAGQLILGGRGVPFEVDDNLAVGGVSELTAGIGDGEGVAFRDAERAHNAAEELGSLGEGEAGGQE